MSSIDRILNGVRQVLLMNEEIKRLTTEVRALDARVLEIDRRLVRVETIAEITQANRTRRPVRKALPGPAGSDQDG